MNERVDNVRYSDGDTHHSARGGNNYRDVRKGVTLMDESEEKISTFEEYTLVLKHEYTADDGKRYPIDRPIYVRYVVYPGLNHPVAVVVNEMLKKLSDFMLEATRDTD